METKRHSVLSNIFFVFQPGIKEHPGYLVKILLRNVLFVCLPLIASATSSLVIWMLGNDFSLSVIIGAILCVFAGYGIVNWIYNYFDTSNGMMFIGMRTKYRYLDDTRKRLNIALEDFENEKVRQLMEKSAMSLSTNWVGVEGTMRNTATLMANILGLCVYILVVGGLSLKILLFLLILCVVNTIVSGLASRAYDRIKDGLAEQERMQNYLNKTVDDIAGGKDIRVFGLSPWLIGKYDAAIKTHRKLLFRYDTVRFFGDLTEVVMGAARNLVCFLYLIAQMKQGMSIAEFAFYLGVIGGFAEWFSKISEMVVEIGKSSRQVDDLRTFLELKGGIMDEGELPEHGFSKIEIVFDHVFYQYPEAKEPVLKDVSFQLSAGEHLALVGLNGAGKSTLVKLMTGLYLPTRGTVYVNGIDTRVLNRRQYINQGAAIFQNPFQLSYTIAENICLNKTIEENRVWAVLKETGLYEKISSLKNGIYTYLGKDLASDGVSLSGGEIQKLLLARALYRDPKFILLDEPTAALDAIAENEVYQAYSETLREKTALFISHRLASTRFCDRIILLEQGKIRETGTHEQLLTQGGRYAELFRIQSKYYQEEV